jgi:SAM-dependent methyltransferase
VNHRESVGGRWQEIGSLTFDFLVRRGMKPDDVLLDIGCGALRAGVHLIPYLDEGNYLGLDIDGALIEAGLRYELDSETVAARKPEFVVSDSFAFDRFSKRPTKAVAQSLFTHLTRADIEACLSNLTEVLDGPCYATFFRCALPVKNPERSHPHERFSYTLKEMHDTAKGCGWTMEYIGPWGHPRKQEMLCFRK